MNTKTQLLLMTIMSTSLVFVGCNKSAEQERREAEKAASEAAKETGKATAEADKKVGEARQKVAGENSEFLAAVNREQTEYRAKITDKIHDAEKRLAELKVDMSKDGSVTYDTTSKSAGDIQRTLKWRDALKQDLDAIGRTQPPDWPTLKARIDRDLSEEGTKPPRTGI